MRRQLGNNIDLLPRAALGSAPGAGAEPAKFGSSPSGLKKTERSQGHSMGKPTLDRPVPSNRLGRQAAQRGQRRQKGGIRRCRCRNAALAGEARSMRAAQRSRELAAEIVVVHLDRMARRSLELPMGASWPTRAARSAGRGKRPALCKAAMRAWW